MKTIPFKLITPTAVAYEGDAELVIVVGTEGEEGVERARCPHVGTDVEPGGKGQVDDLLAAADVSAACAAQRFAERAGEDVDLAHDVVELVRAPAGLAGETDGMRIIHRNHRVVDRWAVL